MQSVADDFVCAYNPSTNELLEVYETHDDMDLKAYADFARAKHGDHIKLLEARLTRTGLAEVMDALKGERLKTKSPYEAMRRLRLYAQRIEGVSI